MFTFDQAKVVRLIPVKHPSRKELNLLVLKVLTTSESRGDRVVRSNSGGLIVTFADGEKASN
ncbi:hypothetical protein Hamer_G029103 [Homarus americanus]|uniref:Uncharacterized protein n=1 Tax=Homarus americanus TaxID=6706 RepID=A0A8J5KC70_HOMAM|nr:hypothetical protein Hamer_G029103 [Homarus americanus]